MKFEAEEAGAGGGGVREGGVEDDSSPHKGSFRTHKQYLSALTATVRQHYGGRFMFIAPAKVTAGIVERFRSVRPELDLTRREVDQDALRRVLMSAWGTEFLLWSGGQMAADEDSEIMALVNQWGVVQAYYACAYATQGVAVAQGNPRPDSHPKTQRLFVQFWIDSYRMFPPWSLAVDHSGPRNFPADIVTDEAVHPWIGIDGRSCWALDALLLRSTRRPIVQARADRRRIELQAARRKAFEREQDARRSRGRQMLRERNFAKPRLSPEQHADLDATLRPTTILDYLYRLRTRSHYQDPAVFFEGPETPDDASTLHRDLKSLTTWTCLLHELVVVELVGKEVFGDAVKAWLRNPVAASAGFGVGRRVDWLL